MRQAAMALGVALLLFAGAGAAEKPAGRELLRDYHGKTQLPDDLYQAYAALVKAIETGSRAGIEKHCLPHSVAFTTASRPPKMREYGGGMNLPFLKEGFLKDVLNLRKDSEDTFLIRTGSSYFFFVRTKSAGWKLYRYGDSPIE